MKMMKKRITAVLAMMIGVLAAGSVALAACQAEEATITEEDDTTNQGDGTTTAVEPEALTTLVAWGDNLYGALGNGTSGHDNPEEDMRSLTPVEVSNLTGVQQFASGTSYSLALKDDGTVWAWGMNQYGQLGNGTIGVDNSSSTPVEVKDPSDPSGYMSGVKAIAAGSSHSLALKEDGTVWAWGNNVSGQLGNGTYTDNSTLGINTPVQVSNLSGVKAITAGGSHSLALKDDGTVWAWGDNKASQGSIIGGQLGDDTITSSNTPMQVGSLGEIKAIGAGSAHGLALKDDGTVWAWGSNQSGQLGNGISTSANETMCENSGQTGMLRSSCPDSNTPVEVTELGGITAIAAGSSHGLALKEDGTVWAWGNNVSGQLGTGTNTLGTNILGISTPAQVSELSGVKAIAAGSSHSLAGW